MNVEVAFGDISIVFSELAPPSSVDRRHPKFRGEALVVNLNECCIVYFVLAEVRHLRGERFAEQRRSHRSIEDLPQPVFE